MREKIVAQPELNFSPSQLKITNEYYRKYEVISTILDQNPEIIEIVHREIGGMLEAVNNKNKGGAPFKYSTDTVVRILICESTEGLSLRGIVIRIDDSHYLRRFVRIDGGPMMDFTTLDKLKNAISYETWKKVNQALAKHAIREGLINGESLRIDTTAVETNIHWPTDSSLLWDVYRVMGRLVEKARELDTDATGNKRIRSKRAKKLASKIARLASNKKPSTRKNVRKLYKKLIEAVNGVLEWSISIAKALQEGVWRGIYGMMECLMAEAVVEEMEHYRIIGYHVIDQARRRVLDDEQVPNEEKIFSIFEPHTELIMRGKQNKPVEFGHMIQIQQVSSKFITDFDVFEKRPKESTLLKPSLENHKELFGDFPDRVATDKGYYESMKVLEELEKTIPIVAIAKKGNRTPEQIEREHNPYFCEAQRFRAGVEGTISFLKRTLRLLRCFNKGWKHFCSTVGMTVFAHNLLNLART